MGPTHMILVGATICVFVYISFVSYYVNAGPRLLQVLTSTKEKNVSSISQEYETDYTKWDGTVETAGSRYVPGFVEPRSSVCLKSGEGVKLLVIIASAPTYHLPRMAIRETWGHFAVRTDVAIAFLVGLSRDAAVEKSVTDEGDLYSDVIRARFYDSYSNLTLKSISMMQWVVEYCPKAKFLLKTDDDMYINMPKLLTFVNEHIKEDNTIFGYLAVKWKPNRNSESKYYLSQKEYGPEVFPSFTTGPAYLLPVVLTQPLYETSLNASFVKLEDVFITGIVAESLNIKRTNGAGFANVRTSLNVCSARETISIHMVKYHEQFDLWKKLSDGTSKCP